MSMLDFLMHYSLWGHAILLFTLVVVFEKIIYCGYVVDDVVRQPHVYNLRTKEQYHQYRTKYFPSYLKQLLYGAGMFNNAKQEYIFNMCLHFINCCLIYKMTQNLIAPFLYLINPINNQTAIWMNGRRYAVALFCVLMAWNFKILAILFYPFGAWIHVSAVAMPLLFLWTKYWWTVPLIALLSIPGWAHYHSVFTSRKSEFKAGNENQVLTWKKGILYVKSIGYYFHISLLPNKPAMYHNFLYYFSSTEEGTKQGYSFNLDFLKGIAVIAFLSYMIIFQHSFGAFWFVLFVSQWCNVLQVTMNSADRYCSLANVGLMIMLAELLLKLPQPFGLMIFTALSVFYIVKYQPLFRAYTSVENFHLYHLHIQPDLVNPRFFLAKMYLTGRDPMSAFALIKKGLKYRPYDFKFLLTMMECMLAMDNIPQAFKVMDLAEKHIPFGEHEDVKNFFTGLRAQYQDRCDMMEAQRRKQADAIAAKMKLHKRTIHNNGQPIVAVK